MSYDKELARTSIYELAPSLQYRIRAKAGSTVISDCTRLIHAIYSRIGDMELSAGVNLPANPRNNNHIHLDIANKVYYGYSNGWFAQRLVYSD